MYTFAFLYSIVLIPHFTVSQTFFPCGYEYYIEKNNFVWSYSEAEEKCNAFSATLAIVNREDIRNNLVRNIGNLTGKEINTKLYQL